MKKIPSLIALSAAALLTLSCGQGMTTITGTYGETAAPDSVHVILPDDNVTLGFPVVNGKFTAKVPTSITGSVIVQGIYLIPDGNAMSIDFSYPEPALDPGSSEINARAQDFLGKEKSLLEERSVFMDAYQQKIDRQEIVEETFYNRYYEIEGRLEALCTATIEENCDNNLAIQALKRIYLDLSNEQLSEVLEKLSPELKSNNFLSVLEAVMKKRASTGEGMKFTDFTISYSDGSPDVHFSDYIGKGKYILVDFWASWCGPCRTDVPYLKQIYKNYKGDKFDILGVAVWDRIVSSKEAIAELSIPWQNILGTGEIASDIYGVSDIPSTILFGPDGTILRRDIRGEEIEAALKEELFR